MDKQFTILRNAVAADEAAIPVMGVDAWRNFIVEACGWSGCRLISVFGNRMESGKVRLYGVVGVDAKGELRLLATDLDGESYPSLTPDLTQAHLFERELHEELAIIPEGHPWLKPVRRSDGHEFYRVSGDGVHEVAVGPVHAGVIEPGHFRFQCNGEKVFNLEIKLGYQRRGVEKLMLSSGAARRMILAESIAGDTSIGHGLAHCHVVEGLANRQVPQRARRIRALALEVERLANHVGDLGAIANDVGYLPAASYFGKLRADFLNVLLVLNGNRFGRGLLRPGGVVFDVGGDMSAELARRIQLASKDVADITELMMNTPSVVSRLQRTGVVTADEAQNIGMVGVAARACGLARDSRWDYPSGFYRFKKILPVKASSGDVFARTRVRILEIKRSIEFVLELLADMPQEKTYFPCSENLPSSIVISLTEGWRGEIVHIARSNAEGKIVQYKVVDPSFRNWSGLELALRGGQISDFPLCNKSFNLSYAGYDL